MASEDNRGGETGFWRGLWRRPECRWLLGIPAGAYAMFALGGLAVVGSEIMIHETGTEEFCATACHSMEAFTTPEWKDSPHYSNPSGVRATCADCHIPHVYPQKLFVKAKSGAWDVYNEILGTIDTREKYDAHRARMAENVWDYMRATDSRECRHCHSEAHFDLNGQSERAARGHRNGAEEGKTCIDCHKGIAHRTPDEVAENNQAALIE